MAFMSEDGKREFLMQLFTMMQTQDAPKDYYDDPPTYKEESEHEMEKVKSETSIPLTMSYEDTDLENHCIAYYRVKGTIMGESRWWFSTKQLVEDMKAAEENPMIVGHFLHVNSGGGDAWYLDIAHAIGMSLQKPNLAFVERIACSAGLYLASAFKKIYASTSNDKFGSIGTMVAFLDVLPYYEKLGLKWIEEYAHKSKLKNKKFNDLSHGKPEKYKEDELDPLQKQFEEDIRKSIKAVAELEENHDLFQGETYRTLPAQELGLIDGIKTMQEVLEELNILGNEYLMKTRSQRTALDNMFN
jgi:ClpP class serine protease